MELDELVRDAAAEGGVDLGPIGGAMGYLLKRAQMAVFSEFNRTFGEVDIRPAQFSILSVIERNPGLSQSQVAAALGIKRTNFVLLLDVLEDRGLVARQPAEGDRRSYALHLTTKGAALVKRLYAIWGEHEARVLSCIGPENRDQLAAWLSAIAAMSGGAGDEGEDDSDPPPRPKGTRGRPRKRPQT